MQPDNINAAVERYRRQVEEYEDFVLVELIAHYELSAGNDRQSQIDALVAHFKQNLQKEGHTRK